MQKLSTTLLFLLASSSLMAGSIEYAGSKPIVIPIEKIDSSRLKAAQEQVVYIQNLRLSQEAKQLLASRVAEVSRESHYSNKAQYEKLPANIYLGMNATPVLNQGVHGSCATFAVTAGIDAVSGNGNYVSQLCSLSLGKYLEQNKMSDSSGWDGAFGWEVLAQLDRFGIVSKSYQKKFGCAGVKSYPLYNPLNTGEPMSISEYTANAIELSEVATWETLYSFAHVFSVNYIPAKALNTVKANLAEGNRVVFGMLLDDSVGSAGALGKYKVSHDTWVLTPEIIQHAENGMVKSGHEMLIIGYDDNAQLIDKKGRISKGMLILRNSWGSRSGDKGNYYMSYDYFKAFSDEVHVIKPGVSALKLVNSLDADSKSSVERVF